MSPARRPEALSYRKDCQWSSPYRGSRLGTQFGPYEVRSLIGVGGMGEVYRAYDTTKGRMVAVKILRSEMAADPSFQERFRRESRMAARLQEPHVIPVHDFGDIGGVLFIGMRLMNGRCANIPATRPFGTSCRGVVKKRVTRYMSDWVSAPVGSWSKQAGDPPYGCG